MQNLTGIRPPGRDCSPLCKQLDIDDQAGTAKAQRYVTVLQQTDNLPLQAIFSGHYHDEFVKEDGEWRFARTVVHQPFVGDMSQHLKNSDFVEGK